MSKPIIILKVGTSSITKDNGELDQAIMVELARQMGVLYEQYHWILVSSGAVANGRKYLENYQGSIIERKAAAAVGNPILLQKYAQFLSPYNISIAQSLCERTHFSNEAQFSQLKQTIRELWKNRVVPIANENDVVSNLELKFSDNDELATLLAVGFGASLLLLGTSVPGVMNSNGQMIPEIANIDENILGLATTHTSNHGLGGMISKLTFARLATKMGIETVIFNVREPGAIVQAVKRNTGTVCKAHPSTIKQRQEWLASGNIVRGKVQVKNKTLDTLAQGEYLRADTLVQVIEPFEKGEVFEILDIKRNSIAVARSQISSLELERLTDQNDKILAHPHEIILL